MTQIARGTLAAIILAATIGVAHAQSTDEHSARRPANAPDVPALMRAGSGPASQRNMGMAEMGQDATGAKFTFGEAGNPADADRVVKITMQDFSFDPASLNVRAGETVRFVVTNNGELDHEFAIGDTKSQTTHRKEMSELMEKGSGMQGNDDPNVVTVKVGQTGELTWKFTRAGSLEFDCNIPGHYESGMKGVITVQAQDTSRGGGAATLLTAHAACRTAAAA